MSRTILTACALTCLVLGLYEPVVIAISYGVYGVRTGTEQIVNFTIIHVMPQQVDLNTRQDIAWFFAAVAVAFILVIWFNAIATILESILPKAKDAKGEV